MRSRIKSTCAICSCLRSQDLSMTRGKGGTHLGGISPECQHARLHADRLELRSVEVVGGARQLLKVDVRRDVHFAGVDLQDLGARVLRGVRKLDLAVQPPRAHQRRIQNVGPVRGRYHLPCHINLSARTLSPASPSPTTTLVPPPHLWQTRHPFSSPCLLELLILLSTYTPSGKTGSGGGGTVRSSHLNVVV